MKLNFYPGPSKLDPKINSYLAEAIDLNIPEYNHRSDVFRSLYQETETIVKEKLAVPENYQLFFISSATEAWEIIAQSFTHKGSFHQFNGSFGEKWRNYAHKLNTTESKEFLLNGLPEKEILETLIDVICITQNETSNGSQVPKKYFNELSKSPNALTCVDATSSLGGVKLPIDKIDVCFASVQKCLGLPSGLGLFICSPKAIEKGLDIDEDLFYNSFTKLHRNRKNWETPYTPNILSIYLLNKILSQRDHIDQINHQTREKALRLYYYLDQHDRLSPMLSEPTIRSKTVICVTGNEKVLLEVNEKASKKAILLGKGYGKWKDSTFRIANFPSITDEEISELIQLFDTL